MILLYRLLLSLAAPLLVGALVWRVLRGRETWGDLSQRLGGGAPLPDGQSIWLHGASNGELTAARGLIEDISAQFADHQLLVTCNTTTARQMVDGWGVAGVAARLAPIDLRWCLGRLLRTVDVRAFVLIEADFWPNRQISLNNRKVPALLLDGRVSASSAETWARMGALKAAVFEGFHAIWPQSAEAKAALLRLGAKNIGNVLTLKAGYAGGAAPDPAMDRAKTWLAASTHEGEDEIILEAHRAARRHIPDLRLILAPRHPKRGDAIAAMIASKGFGLSRRSTGEAPTAEVYLADTLGEMPRWYASSFACFVAGSLVDKGGHTPFEPIAHGAAVLHGPYTENFRDIYAQLDASGGAVLAPDATALAQAICQLSDPSVAQAQTRQAKLIANAAQPGNATRSDVLNTLDKLALNADRAKLNPQR